VITASLSVEVTEIEYEPDFPTGTFQPPPGSRALDTTVRSPSCSHVATGDLPRLEVTFQNEQFSYVGPSEVDAGVIEVVLSGPAGTQVTLVGLATGVTPDVLMEGISTDPYQDAVAERSHLPIELAVAVASVEVCQDSAVVDVPLLPGTYVVLGGKPLNQADLIATITVQE
jgi:hypothetical protein